MFGQSVGRSVGDGRPVGGHLVGWPARDPANLPASQPVCLKHTNTLSSLSDNYIIHYNTCLPAGHAVSL